MSRKGVVLLGVRPRLGSFPQGGALVGLAHLEDRMVPSDALVLARFQGSGPVREACWT